MSPPEIPVQIWNKRKLEEEIMGIIRAAVDTARGTLSDQWLDVVEAGDMGEQTLFTEGNIVRQGSNRRGNSDVISNGSVIHVYDNQFMILTDGGKIIDYSAEPGYYTVDNASAPSLFNGDLVGDVLKDSFNRFKFGGGKPVSMKVYFLNLQEIRGIRFGTRNPVNYFDNFYNSELFLRTHGSYSIKITDPIRFYTEVVPRNASHLEVEDINQQFLDEFLEALQSAISQMSVDGIRISHVTSKTRELSKYMAQVLDEDWKKARGIEIQSVGIASVSYDEESQKLINMRNQGAMMGDPTIREGFVQSSIAKGLEAAGSNANGAMAGYMGMGMGMQGAGGFMSAASNTNMQQMNQQAQYQQQMNQQQAQYQQQYGQQPQYQQQMPPQGQYGQQQPNQQYGQPQGGQQPSGDTWTCACGAVNTGNFCPNCGGRRPAPAAWTCSCGTVNTGKFCPNCGKPRP